MYTYWKNVEKFSVIGLEGLSEKIYLNTHKTFICPLDFVQLFDTQNILKLGIAGEKRKKMLKEIDLLLILENAMHGIHSKNNW